jgi:hypothetical protein
MLITRRSCFHPFGAPCISASRLRIPPAPFIAACAIKKARIAILAIYHGAQHWPEAF